MSAEAKGVAVQKYKPKATPHILDQTQGDSAARSDTVIHLSQDAVERALWAAMRSLEERADLTGRLAKRAEQQAHRHAAGRFRHQSEAARKNADVLRRILTNGEEIQVRERHDEEAKPA